MKTVVLILASFAFCIPFASCRIPDWLVKKLDFPARLINNTNDQTLTLTNGIISRTFSLSPGFVTIDFYSHETNSSLLRALSPEVICPFNILKLFAFPFIIWRIKLQHDY